MGQIKNYPKLAEDIFKEVGGKNNIINVSRCATRLRLVLKDTPTDLKERVGCLTGVITVLEKGGQFQIVIGTSVGKVYDEIIKILGDNLTTQENIKQPILNRIIATMSAVFAPFVYILAAAGILQGILILINLAYPNFATTGTYEVFSFISWTPFSFLPILIAITASKHFKCNTFIAVTCCAALINPAWVEIASRVAKGESLKFLIFDLNSMVYASSVLPPLFLVWILSYLEKWIDKKLPDVIKSLFVPFFCMVIMVPLTILLIGPITNAGANAVSIGFNFIMNKVPMLGGVIISGFWQVFVIFGIHWGVTPMVLANFSNNGFDYFQAYQTLAVIAQMAASFGVFLKSKNHEFKRVAFSAGVTGIFGITEPALYGVTLYLKKPFICACIGGAIGAIAMSFFNTVYYAYAGLPGLLTIVNAINPTDSSKFIGMLVGTTVTIITTILLIQFVGFAELKEKNK